MVGKEFVQNKVNISFFVAHLQHTNQRKPACQQQIGEMSEPAMTPHTINQ
jgi:hypothetical protein